MPLPGVPTPPMVVAALSLARGGLTVFLLFVVIVVSLLLSRYTHTRVKRGDVMFVCRAGEGQVGGAFLYFRVWLL